MLFSCEPEVSEMASSVRESKIITAVSLQKGELVSQRV